MADDRTVRDFGEQWTRFPEPATGWYGSLDSLRDISGPLLDLEKMANQVVLDLGAGTGRFTRMLLQLGASRVIAVEPSRAVDALRANTLDVAHRIDIHNIRGDQLALESQADLAIAIGVLHHIPDPDPVVRAIHRALKPGGRFLVWLYGQEGNENYLRIVQPLRRLAAALPPAARIGLAVGLMPLVDLYVLVCLWLPLPLHGFMRGVQAKLTWRQRLLNIYDQINPTHAKYYTRDAALRLLTGNGFQDVRCHHRRGYSWSVIGTKP
jgi:SAM-dependent methyltransferase